MQVHLPTQIESVESHACFEAIDINMFKLTLVFEIAVIGEFHTSE